MKAYKIVSGIIIVFCLLLSSEIVFAQANGNGGNLGVGIMLGEPTGITLKKWNNERTALDLGVAWSFEGNNDAILVQADYVIHNWFSEVESGRLAWYYGIGGRAVFANDAIVGARVPVGLNYLFERSPLDMFVEIAPILDLVPDTEFSGNATLGIRYYF